MHEHVVTQISPLVPRQRWHKTGTGMYRLLTRFCAVIWSCALKDMKSAATERATLLQTLSLPVNYLIMLILFVLSGSNAPTAVVLFDHGPYAQAFVQAMQQAHSFHVMVMSQQEAQARMTQGTLVALVTIPADFDTALKQQRRLQVPVEINNLNVDLTDDARRGMHLVVTSFYAAMFPGQIAMTVQEQDAYPNDLQYIPFLALSISVISLMVTGLLQGGMATAREWEKDTIKELLLAPTQAWAILLGKMLGAFLFALPSVAVVLSVIIFFIGDWPVHVGLVIGVSLLTLLLFVAAGVALGMLLKDRSTLTTVTRAVPVPLFFLSGVFGLISYQTSSVQIIARALPIHYAIVLEQYAFKQLFASTLPLWWNALVLLLYLLVFFGLATLAMQQSTLAH